MKILLVFGLGLGMILGLVNSTSAAVLTWETIKGEVYLVEARDLDLNPIYYLVLRTNNGKRYIIVGELADYLKEKIEQLKGRKITITGMQAESVAYQGEIIKVVYAKDINNIEGDVGI